MATYKDNSIEELHKNVADKREVLRSIRHMSAGSRSRNVRESREIKKDIARMMTELSARAIASKAKTA